MNRLKRFAARSQQWPRELLQWFGAAPFFWLILLAPLMGALLVFWWCPEPKTWRKVTGAVFEVFGLFAVGRGLYRQQQRFDPQKRTLWTRAQGYFGTFPPPWGRKPISGDSAVVLESAEMRASASAFTPMSATTPEERITMLEAEIKVIQANVANIANRQAEHEQASRERLTQEERERLKADERTARDVVELAIGDLPAQVLGWCWLVAGAILHGIP